jgi:peptide/nickel transport system substrate-binding protein
MENPYSRIRQFKVAGKLPTKDQINLVFHTFSKKEWIVFSVLALTLFFSALSIVQIINKSLMVEIPLRGGVISEGIIGTPRFINPILATSSADLDMTSLIYSGLMRKNSDATISPDLAEKVDISKDGLVYTFTLKDNIYFHNEDPITVDDIIFTINKAKDSIIKSPRKVDWEGVSVEKLDEKTIEFTLRQPNPSFLENTTLGILPQSIWSDAPVELNDANTNPVGSGPYMIKSFVKETSGVINSYELVAFEKFVLGEPYIEKLNLFFYPNEEDLMKALDKKEVEQISSITPLNADILKERNYQIDSSVLPRVFGLFFNQNQNQLFTNKVITKAIDQAIDKDKIVREVLFGYGIAIDDPMPPNMIAYQKLAGGSSLSREEILKNVISSLEKDGWTKNEEGFLQKTTTDKNKKKSTTLLEFSISTGNAPELAKAAELIQKDLSAIGMKVDIKTFEVGNLNQSVIRPRKYDALLFGQIINRESDLFAFWHSSQRKDPGLNVALYTNAKVDKILEDAFTTVNEQERIKKYAQFEDEVKKDMPAVFLYSPDFIYVVSKELKGILIDHIIMPRDRFSNVYRWYIKTEDVWKIFAQ